MEQHKIVLSVSFVMDEMDGSTYESAEIAMGIMQELLHEHTAWDTIHVETTYHDHH